MITTVRIKIATNVMEINVPEVVSEISELPIWKKL
jgi:hypothetical protein